MNLSDDDFCSNQMNIPLILFMLDSGYQHYSHQTQFYRIYHSNTTACNITDEQDFIQFASFYFFFLFCSFIKLESL